MTGVYEIRPAEWWDWPFHGVVAEQASIPAVTMLPASDDPQAAAVRFSYPSPVVAGSCPVAMSPDELEREFRHWMRRREAAGK